MIYSAAGLALIGAAVGFAFRWKILLPIIVLLPLVAMIFSVLHRFSFMNTLIVIAIAEGVLQGGYVLGLALSVLTAAILQKGGGLNVLKARLARSEQTKDAPTSPSAGAGEAP